MFAPQTFKSAMNAGFILFEVVRKKLFTTKRVLASLCIAKN